MGKKEGTFEIQNKKGGIIFMTKSFVTCVSILAAEFTGLMLCVAHLNLVLAFLIGATAVLTARVMARVLSISQSF